MIESLSGVTLKSICIYITITYAMKMISFDYIVKWVYNTLYGIYTYP